MFSFLFFLIPYISYLQVINKDHHKRLDEFEFWTDWTTDYGFSCPLASKNQLFSSPEPLGSQGELIVYPSSRRPSVRPSSVVVNNFKHLLLRNRWADQSQILCGASLGRRNDSLFAASGSHDQDCRHAHIYGKNPSKIFSSRTGGPIFTKLGM